MANIKIDKNYKGLKNVGWRYELQRDLECDGSIEVDLDMGLFVGGSIEAGGYIEAGGSRGISAGLSITCKGLLKFGLKCFAGICTWRDTDEDDRTITCGKLEGGVVEYGILKETGLETENETKKKAILKKIEELKAEADKL